MIIEFEENEHIYSVNGEIATISVTELLRKHGIAPNYSFANSETLQRASEIGTAVHKDLENVLNLADYEPQTMQGEQFKEWAEKFKWAVGEQKLAYVHEESGVIISGTADVIGVTKNGEYVLGDHKNTNTFHRNYVTWQVNILDWIARQLNGRKVNGVMLDWKGADRFYCYHYNPNTCEMKVYELEKISDKEIERLIECEIKGEIYQQPMLIIENELREQVDKAEQYLQTIETQYKQAKATAEQLRNQLLTLMEQQQIKSWETDNVKVTYVAGQERITLDSAKVKAEYPQVFTACQKLSKVKPSIRVTIKELPEDEI